MTDWTLGRNASHSPVTEAEIEGKFWRRVVVVEDCWEWVGASSVRGYGRFAPGRPHPTMAAHRWSFCQHIGPIPAGMHVLHRCDNPRCVKPAHLFLGTDADNARDRTEKGRGVRGEHVNTARLCAKDIPQIIARRTSGETQASVARAYGVDPHAIAAILAGRTWRHVPR